MARFWFYKGQRIIPWLIGQIATYLEENRLTEVES